MRRRDRGMALLAILGILAVLMILATSFAGAVRTETQLTAGAVKRTQASWLAEAGLQRAYVELRDDPNRFTMLHEDAQNGEPLVLHLDSSDEADTLGLTGGRFEVRAFDEAGRVNLNTASEEYLNNLLPYEPELVAAILDWRDSDEDLRDSGAENEYYQALSDPYNARNDWFSTLGELLLLRDVSPARVYGQDNLSPLADPEQSGTVSEDQVPLGEQFSVTSMDANTDLDGAARIDVTTATRDELTEAFEDDLTAEEIDAIISYREQPASEGEPGAGGPGGAAGPGAALAPGGAALAPGATAPVAAPTGAENGEAGTEAAGTGEAEEEDSRPKTVAELIGVIGREKLQVVYDRMTTDEDELKFGQLNLNTASVEALAALPGMDSTLAQAIVDARQQEPFETVGDLLRLTEITDEIFQQIAPLITTRSLAYRLTAEGTVGEGEYQYIRRIEAIVLMELTSAAAAAAAESDTTVTTTATEGETAAPQRKLRLIYRHME